MSIQTKYFLIKTNSKYSTMCKVKIQHNSKYNTILPFHCWNSFIRATTQLS